MKYIIKHRIKIYINRKLNLLKLIFIIFVFYCLIFSMIKKDKKNIKLENDQKLLYWSIIKNDCLNLINKYKILIKEEKNISNDSPIWVMWYQGIKNAPPLIKACIKSLIINAEKHPVYLLDQNNYSKYIKLPSFILEKFNNKTFSITHFSDIIRMALLSIYGGYWIDSTYLITSAIMPINSTFFSLKLSYCGINSCLWAGNFLGMSKINFLATYVYNALLLYWKKYNFLIDYFLIDFFISYAYENVTEFKKKIDELPYINCNIFSLAKLLNYSYDNSSIYCKFNKLSRHIKGQMYNNSKITNYGYIIKNYKPNYEWKI